VKGLLNFAPVLLRAPPGVRVVTVDLAIQLEQLAFLVQMSDPAVSLNGHPPRGLEPPGDGR
jgi:redox-sensing transcriptional repressor